jgi:hypothetical protein
MIFVKCVVCSKEVEADTLISHIEEYDHDLNEIIDSCVELLRGEKVQ